MRFASYASRKQEESFMRERNAQNATISDAIELHKRRPGALLPIAKELNLSRAEVHGVVTFYHHFRSAPPGEHVVRICRAEACQAMGADGLVAHAKKALGVDFHGTTKDGAVTLEAVYCLGNCACSPAVMVDDDLHGRVSKQRFDAIVKNLRSAK